MRSPAFLEAMRQNLKVMTGPQEISGSTHRGYGPAFLRWASDIHGLFERLNKREQAILPSSRRSRPGLPTRSRANAARAATTTAENTNLSWIPGF
ncbi:MAG: hypothetical protein U0794_06485 [Isosphaeraceae bacterium]